MSDAIDGGPSQEQGGLVASSLKTSGWAAERVRGFGCLVDGGPNLRACLAFPDTVWIERDLACARPRLHATAARRGTIVSGRGTWAVALRPALARSCCSSVMCDISVVGGAGPAAAPGQPCVLVQRCLAQRERES